MSKKKEETTVVKRFRPSMRQNFAMVFLPGLALPIGLYLMYDLWLQGFDEYYWYLAWAVLCLSFIVVAWARTLTNVYEIRLDAVMARDGFFSRKTSEIRVRDIRNITVVQSLSERMLRIGTIAFSSSAGDREEVRFIAAPDPEGIKRLVQGLQDRLTQSAEAPSSAGEAAAPAPSATPKPKAKPAAGGDEDTKSELERLLAEQLADEE